MEIIQKILRKVNKVEQDFERLLLNVGEKVL